MRRRSTMALVLGIMAIGFMMPMMAEGQQKMPLCHIDEFGDYHIVTIAEAAWQSHYDHGDKDIETFYIDADGDGFGSGAMTVEDCTAPEGFVDKSGDCADTRFAVNPEAVEVAGNELDDDCNPETSDGEVMCPCDFSTFTEENWSAGLDALKVCPDSTDCHVEDNDLDLSYIAEAECDEDPESGARWIVNVDTFRCEVERKNASGPVQNQNESLSSAQLDACVSELEAQRAKIISEPPSCSSE